MANSMEPAGAFSFSDFPEDVQLCILSFLSPSDLSTFACTSKRFVSLCHGDSRVWYAMCDRRWGSETQIRKWGDGKVGFKLLFKTLSEYENLIGFWRRSGSGAGSGPGPGILCDAPLVFFEWGASCVTGSRVVPSKNGSYNVTKSPFIWMSLSSEGQALNYLKAPEKDPSLSPNSNIGLIRVSVSFLGKGHVVLEECKDYGNANLFKRSESFGNGNGNGNGNVNVNGEALGLGVGLEVENGVVSVVGSPPERVTSEIYQYFANKTSPGSSGERAWRRQRRREKERQARRRWEPEHLVKIVNSSPTPSRPLQGLWKGIGSEMTLDFYLVAYDDMGGIACRRVVDSLTPFSGHSPVLWTSNATCINSPLSHEEDYLYNTRMHLRPIGETEDDFFEHSPSHIMYINSSYDLVIPHLAGYSANQRHVEGRIWLYADGTFGFGFLHDNFIVDLKHIAQLGRLLNIDELCCG